MDSCPSDKTYDRDALKNLRRDHVFNHCAQATQASITLMNFGKQILANIKEVKFEKSRGTMKIEVKFGEDLVAIFNKLGRRMHRSKFLCLLRAIGKFLYNIHSVQEMSREQASLSLQHEGNILIKNKLKERLKRQRGQCAYVTSTVATQTCKGSKSIRDSEIENVVVTKRLPSISNLLSYPSHSSFQQQYENSQISPFFLNDENPNTLYNASESRNQSNVSFDSGSFSQPRNCFIQDGQSDQANYFVEIPSPVDSGTIHCIEEIPMGMNSCVYAEKCSFSDSLRMNDTAERFNNGQGPMLSGELLNVPNCAIVATGGDVVSLPLDEPIFVMNDLDNNMSSAENDRAFVDCTSLAGQFASSRALDTSIEDDMTLFFERENNNGGRQIITGKCYGAPTTSSATLCPVSQENVMSDQDPLLEIFPDDFHGKTFVSL